MNHLARISLAAVLLFAVDQAARPQPKPVKATEDVGGGDVERGRYIVESVAMCTRCHTPGGDRGAPDRAHWLQGAPIRCPEPNLAVFAPRIAGRPPGTDEEFVNLLVTGISRSGKPPRPPMPSFRMNRKDAESVLAYLKSLNR